MGKLIRFRRGLGFLLQELVVVDVYDLELLLVVVAGDIEDK